MAYAFDKHCKDKEPNYRDFYHKYGEAFLKMLSTFQNSDTVIIDFDEQDKEKISFILTRN